MTVGATIYTFVFDSLFIRLALHVCVRCHRFCMEFRNNCIFCFFHLFLLLLWFYHSQKKHHQCLWTSHQKQPKFVSRSEDYVIRFCIEYDLIISFADWKLSFLTALLDERLAMSRPARDTEWNGCPAARWTKWNAMFTQKIHYLLNDWGVERSEKMLLFSDKFHTAHKYCNRYDVLVC